jgi:uncharacterized repeat protein (TIGR03803 family)
MKRTGSSGGPDPVRPATGIYKPSKYRVAAIVLAAIATILVTAASCAASDETVLHTFTTFNTGIGPDSGLAIDAAGNLYGTTYQSTSGCVPTCGNVYKLTKNSNGGYTFSVIHNFRGQPKDGAAPWGAPVLDSAGNVYGTTTNGGSGCGVVYKLSPAANGTYTSSILHSFNAVPANDDGCQPYSTLAFDQAGNLYGTTNQGGGGGVGGTFCFNGCGAVFKLAANSDGTWTESVIHSFPGTEGSTDGQNPRGGVVFDSKGNLWSTTQTGGNLEACLQFQDFTGCGTVFELTPNEDGTWTESNLFAFTGMSTGFNPWDGLVVDSKDNLYGMTTNGGIGNGTVFRVTPQPGGGVKEAIIHTFAVCNAIRCPDGVHPFNGLTIDASGNLYGTVFSGGGAGPSGGGFVSGDGIVFKLTPNSNGKWSEDILYRFRGESDGGFPQGDRVVLDGEGNIFGTASNGGAFNLCPVGCGVVFKVVQ